MSRPVPVDRGEPGVDGFFEIYDAHHEAVRRFVQATIRDDWAADDLVQETFLRVMDKVDTLKEPSSLRAWIYRIALNLCRDYLRSRSRRGREAGSQAEWDQLLDAMPAPCSSAETALARHQMNACMQHKIKMLPQSQRTVLCLFDVNGLSQQEIAEVLDISVQNVKVRLHRARKSLKKILQAHCSFEKDERDVLVCEPINHEIL